MEHSIALSYGATFSVIAVLNKDSRPEIIANEDGEHKIPTCLSFTETDDLAGTQALTNAVRHSINTITGFRNLIGLKFDAAEAARRQVPGWAKIVATESGHYGYSVEVQGQQTVLSVDDVTTRFLRRVRESAEGYLGRSISHVVLAVPQNFSAEQRAALANASAAAGLAVEQFINEPAAACLGYGVAQESSRLAPNDKTIVVVDSGASTTAVSVVASRGGLLSVIASRSIETFNGSILDEALMKHFAAEFQKKTGIDVAGNVRAQFKLRTGCEITKKTLSSIASAPCSVESLAEGMDLHSNVNRMRFDIMTSRLYTPLEEAIQSVVEEAGYKLAEIDQVLLAGGATRVPKVRSKIEDVFPESVSVISPEVGESDEVIASGCAIHLASIASAALFNAGSAQKKKSAEIESAVSAPALAFPIGVVDATGKFITLIPRATPLPAVRQFTMGSAAESALVQIHEGETVQVVIPPQPKPEKKPAAEGDDSDDDDDDDEDEEKIETVTKAKKLLVELAMTGLKGSEKKTVPLLVTVGVDAQSKVHVSMKTPNGTKIIHN